MVKLKSSKNTANRLTCIAISGILIAVVSAPLVACLPFRATRAGAHSSTSPMPSNQQEGAPYPADMEHLEQILAIGSGHKLPEGADVASVTPAVEYTKHNPRGWGYIIAFTATAPAIRQYVTENTNHSGDIIEDYSTAKPGDIQLSDLNFDEISRPWRAGFSDGALVLERPLGRGWLIINGSSR